MKKVSNNEAWEHIFTDLKILDQVGKNNFFDISATEIKKRDGKEARLMTKVDHRENLPIVMSNNGLSILAIKNGLYRIAKTDPFIDIQKVPLCNVEIISKPTDILSIDPLNLKSESSALDIAYISKMLDIVFDEQTELTIRGRLRGNLSFNLSGVPYNIDGVQIEVDGGYEGLNTLNLIEAKMGFRNNINIRQLLYPELFWKSQNISKHKKIQNYVFYYQDDIFRFIPFIYDYKSGNFYADHHRERAFRFERHSYFSLSHIKKSHEIMVNDDIAFPQADDFEKIHAIFLNIDNHDCPTKIDIIGDFDISLTSRQHDYYFNVLRWLRVCVINDDGCITLTGRGNKLLELNIEQRMEELSRIIFSEPICFNVLHNLSQNDLDFKRYNINGSTIYRRLQTVRAWIKYFNNFFTKKLL